MNVSLSKHRRQWSEIEQALAVLHTRFPSIAPLTLQTHKAAVSLARTDGLAFYDALIIASAMEARCGLLVSEDLQHGHRFGGLIVRNPFA